MTTSEQFVHDPLDTTRQTIRIIKLDKSSRKGNIKCTLKHVEIKDNAHVCLSYAWGPETPTHTIHINGKAFEVRYNLWMFLQKAKKQRIKDWLWIDAICIDQRNPDERGHQVQLMGEIYRKAERVLVHAGEVSWKMEFLAFIVRLFRRRHTHRLYGRLNGILARSVQPLYTEFEHLPYWSRMWIVQEILLAKSVDIMLARTRLNIRALWFLGSSSTPIRDVLYLHYYEGTSGRCGSSRLRDSWLTLMFTAKLLCEEQNDHIYALLGIFDYGCFDNIPVDYTRNWSVLMLDLAQAMEKWESKSKPPAQFGTFKVISILQSFNFSPITFCRTCAKANDHASDALQGEKLKVILQNMDDRWDLVWIADETALDVSLCPHSHLSKNSENQDSDGEGRSYHRLCFCYCCANRIVPPLSPENGFNFEHPSETIMFGKISSLTGSDQANNNLVEEGAKPCEQ